MSETPRTDEFWTARLKGPAISQRHPYNTEWVAFARQLERELNAALLARPEEGFRELVEKMSDAVLDTDASGRPVANLYDTWVELRSAISTMNVER